MTPEARWAIAYAAAFLAGSIPFGLVLGLLRGVDIRDHGSGNIGATNAMRVLGPRVGVLCLALDMLKGALPTALLGMWCGVFGAQAPGSGPSWLWMGLAASCVLGHMYSPWIGFRGGKGVATGFGALVAMWPLLTLPAVGGLLVFVLSARITMYVGISSCFAASSIPLWVVVLRAAGVVGEGTAAERLRDGWPTIAGATLLGVVVVWKHRGNIARTLAGTERRIGERVRTDGGGAGA